MSKKNSAAKESASKKKVAAPKKKTVAVKRAAPTKTAKAVKKVAARKAVRTVATKPKAGNAIPTVKGVSDIRRFFYRNETPIYFISATNFNL
ncbi:MAG TPA: hypothetical protein PLE71_16200, partial [Flavobacteriales bacterium]|nr:hypothetical protein [Flavobacteriales bacterium]